MKPKILHARVSHFEAVQFQGTANWVEVQGWCQPDEGKNPFMYYHDSGEADLWDEIEQNWIPVRVGDWIVRGLDGEFFLIAAADVGENRYYAVCSL